MAVGGSRPGAGRKRGSIGIKRQQVSAEIALKRKLGVADGEKLPLDIMLEALNLTYRKEGAVAAFTMAEAVAPYLHPKRQPVNATGSSNYVVELINFADVV